MNPVLKEELIELVGTYVGLPFDSEVVGNSFSIEVSKLAENHGVVEFKMPLLFKNGYLVGIECEVL